MKPWHFGGDPVLTYQEIESYMDAAKQLNDARRKQAAEAKRTRRR